MTTWTDVQLDRLGGAHEVRIAGCRRDGSLRKPVIVWLVRSGDDLYTRSVKGPEAAWFRGTRELLAFSMLVALGGADAQVKGHVAANLNVGNDRATLLSVLTVPLPFIGYPRTLNGLAAVNAVTA